MSTNNKVFQVLVASATPLKAAGNGVSSLAAGQIGIFNVDTGLSITAAVAKEFYLAVGPASGKEVRFSAGQSINSALVKSVTIKSYVAPVASSFTLGGFAAENDTDYALKLEFRDMQIYMRQGTNQFTKTYAVTTSSNLAIEPNQDLAWKMYSELLLDESGLFTVTINDPVTPFVAFANKAAYDVWVGNNAADAPNIIVTATALAETSNSGINPQYYFPRNTKIIPSLVDGFTEEATLTVTSEGVAEQGSGYDLRQKEYVAGGWNGYPGVYRTSSHLGFPYSDLSDAFTAVEATNYAVVHIVYDASSESGHMFSNLETIVAFPNTTAQIAVANAFIDALEVATGLVITGVTETT